MMDQVFDWCVLRTTGLLGRNSWHYLQRNQRLGVCHHLAATDGNPDWYYCRTAQNAQEYLKAITVAIGLRIIRSALAGMLNS